MMKYAPNIDKMQKLVRKKLKQQVEENEKQLQSKLKTFTDTEADLRKRLKQLEA
jgi:molybdopterin-biosynthesis enzyme MoeA-like protein